MEGGSALVLPVHNDTISTDLANYEAEPPMPDVRPVGSYPLGVSAEGVHDLIGNVWEWVDGWYAPYELAGDEPLDNPQGPETGKYRLLRGSCFLCNEPLYSTHRGTADPAFDWG